MAQTMQQYYESGLNRNRGVINLATDTIRLALVDSGYTPDLDVDTIWGDVSAHEVANGDGYTTGGVALTGQTLTRADWCTTLDANDITFTALTKTFRYGVLYVVGTKAYPGGGPDIVNPLFALVLFDDTPADVAVVGVDYVVQWSSLGIAQFGPSEEF